MDDRPHTHTQYQDRPADDDSVCRSAEHHFIDGEVEGVAVCSRCGLVLTDEDGPL